MERPRRAPPHAIASSAYSALLLLMYAVRTTGYMHTLLLQPHAMRNPVQFVPLFQTRRFPTKFKSTLHRGRCFYHEPTSMLASIDRIHLCEVDHAGFLRFASYYAKQRICGGDLTAMLDAMLKPYPIDFRVNPNGQLSDRILRFLRRQQALFEKGGEERLEEVEFYPDHAAWRYFSPPGVNTSLQDFLTQQQDRGAISRQELVSMLPAFYLNCSSDHNILDMCASPGSKTTQISHLLQSNFSGVLIANELDRRRIGRLTHRLQKECDCQGTLVTQFDARHLPLLPRLDLHRILADVPCSGDGYLRRKPSGWRGWDWREGARLHRTQRDILLRGMRLLAPGGTLVYSTCSLNPLEDEAVVAAALRSWQGGYSDGTDVTVVDVPELPGVHTSPGMDQWMVPVAAENGCTDTKKGDNLDEVEEDIQWLKRWDNVACNGAVTKSLFPPDEEEEEVRAAVRRCRRLLPHRNDAGGFFVAVMRKSARGNVSNAKETSTEGQSEVPSSSSSVSSSSAVSKQTAEDAERGRQRMRRLEVQLTDTRMLRRIGEFYGIRQLSAASTQPLPTQSGEKPPSLDPGLLLWSSADGSQKHKICLVSPALRAFLADSWFPTVAQMPSARRRLKRFGLTALWPVVFRSSERGHKLKATRGGAEGDRWQVCQEALGVVRGHVTRRHVRVTCRRSFLALLRGASFPWADLLQLEGEGLVSGLAACAQPLDTGADSIARLRPVAGGLICSLESCSQPLVFVSCVLSEEGELHVAVRDQELRGLVTLLEQGHSRS